LDFCYTNFFNTSAVEWPVLAQLNWAALAIPRTERRARSAESSANRSSGMLDEEKLMNPMAKIAAHFNNVSLRIPILGIREKTIKGILTSLVKVGGKVGREDGQQVVTALDTVNCTIYQGERVALLGHNGAGKSTFLRVISNIFPITSGELTLATQFEPLIDRSFYVSDDLAALEIIKAHYIFMNGNAKGFDTFLLEILDFTELSDFVNIPVRTFSTGMRMRLNFALLTSHAHESLAIDEGFGAGDQWFLQKAEKRIKRFIDDVGTLVLASHSNELLKEFCERGLVFEGGRIIFDGTIKDAIAFYELKQAV
jgi:ABC-type polysaccharide/polyol phosphate transport system ATPase subunit